jgi:hypothetical protein
MKKLLILASAALLPVLLIATVVAGPNDAPATQKKEEGQVQKTESVGKSVQPAPKNTGTSVVERYEKRREIKKRAEAKRKAVIKKEQQNKNAGKQPQGTAK